MQFLTQQLWIPFNKSLLIMSLVKLLLSSYQQDMQGIG